MEYSDLLKLIISEFIEDVDNVIISENEKDDVINLSIKPSNRSDVAKIIGKKGRTISALRVILRASCNCKNANGEAFKRIRVTVLEQ